MEERRMRKCEKHDTYYYNACGACEDGLPPTPDTAHLPEGGTKTEAGKCPACGMQPQVFDNSSLDVVERVKTALQRFDETRSYFVFNVADIRELVETKLR
jgi:hypothetical protein